MDIIIDPLDTDSIDEAIMRLEEYASRLEDTEAYLSALCYPAGLKAEQRLAQQKSRYPDDLESYEPVVNLRIGGSEAVIEAVGDEVGFAEFGTGVYNPEWGGVGDTPDYMPYPHGTYGKGHGRQFRWYYSGANGESRSTEGMFPAEGMLEAWLHIKENEINVGRRVFAEDD